MALYITCPYCGSHLDYGEQCDCNPYEQRQAEPEEHTIQKQEVIIHVDENQI